MTVSISALKGLAAAGGTVEQLIATVQGMVDDDAFAVAERRRKDRERKRRSRAVRNVTRTSRTSRDAPQRIDEVQLELAMDWGSTPSGHADGHANAAKEMSPQTPLKEILHDTAPREDVLTPVDQVLEAIGVRDDPDWFGERSLRVDRWLQQWDLDRDVLPTVQRLMAKRHGRPPPRSPAFFEEAIAETHARRQQPLPHVVVDNLGRTNGHAYRNGSSTRSGGLARLAARLAQQHQADPPRGGFAEPVRSADRPGDSGDHQLHRWQNEPPGAAQSFEPRRASRAGGASG